MGEESETEKTEPVKDVKVAEPEVTKADLERLQREWEGHARGIKDDLEKLHAGDVAEREELKRQLKEANDYIEQLKKAESERDKVKESSSTMVMPPSDIPPAQPNVAPQGPPATSSQERPRHRLRDLW